MLATQDNHVGSCCSFRMAKPLLQEQSLVCRNDECYLPWYLLGMAAPTHDWYLKEWLKTLGKKQADIVRDLDWNKARISLMLHGKQPYDRDSVNELTAYLHLKPYEILMHPQDAMALRQLQKTAIEIAHAADDLDSKISNRG